jgi:hypothetical protein
MTVAFAITHLRRLKCTTHAPPEKIHETMLATRANAEPMSEPEEQPERPVISKRGLVCPICCERVAVDEAELAGTLVFQCPDCGHCWMAGDTGAIH